MTPPKRPYHIYTAGGLFTHDELATNVALKEALWRQSGGKFLLHLPQSKGDEQVEGEDLALTIRNIDLLHVLRADLLLARFDGLELDAGTVAEFMLAKWLGKPTVILRGDSRRMAGHDLDDPYNLMVRNWPRTVQVHIASLTAYVDRFLAAQKQNGVGEADVEALLKAELAAAREGLENMAAQVLTALEAALAMPSPYPEEDRARVYHLARLAPGGGFDKLLTEGELAAILASLREQGTL